MLPFLFNHLRSGRASLLFSFDLCFRSVRVAVQIHITPGWMSFGEDLLYVLRRSSCLSHHLACGRPTLALPCAGVSHRICS